VAEETRRAGWGGEEVAEETRRRQRSVGRERAQREREWEGGRAAVGKRRKKLISGIHC
jgi:hypothetical protein